MTVAKVQSFVVNGRRLEAQWHGPRHDVAPTLVLLHEGLGCVAMWRDFPKKLAARTGCGVLAYSRAGYGGSDPGPLPWPLTYMHDEAERVLPAVLDQANIRKCILIGHSDGASIATIYAGGRQDFRVRGLVLMAPHFFVEDSGIRAIEAARQAYETGRLRAGLERFHRNVDVAFRGWNDAWLDPGFRAFRIDDAIAHIRVPILILQGEDDAYGTLAQIHAAEREAYCPVEVTMLARCGHSPHLDQPAATLEAVGEFVHRLLAVHEGLLPAA
jgi:pimeloyl-ACP methyl ester carboxylesterase